MVELLRFLLIQNFQNLPSILQILYEEWKMLRSAYIYLNNWYGFQISQQYLGPVCVCEYKQNKIDADAR